MRRTTGRITPMWLATLSMTLALLWPSIVNRQPFIFTDTSTYVRGFDAAIYKATGIASRWTSKDTVARTGKPASGTAGAGTVPQPAGRPSPHRDVPPVLAGRSIYYGALIYVSDKLAGLWPLALLQAALVAMAMAMTLRRMGHPDKSTSAADIVIAGFIILLTPAAYFVGMAMPDIFGGLAILAAASLLLTPERRDWCPRLFWTALLAASLLFHGANLLVVLGMLAIAVLSEGLRVVRLDRRGLAALLVAIVVAQIGDAAFTFAVSKTTGHPPIRPPFVTARLIDDGPGTDYLSRTCPGSGFAACAYLDLLPLSSDRFLWAGGRGGVFSSAPPRMQRRLAEEDSRFATQVLRDRPGQVAATILGSIARQLGRSEMAVFNYPPFRIAGYREKLPADIMDAVTRTRAYHERMPVHYLEVIDLPVAGLSLIWIGIWIWRNRKQQPELAAFSTLIVGAFFINAIVFGALSTPHGRYQNRVIWVLPLIALPLAIRKRNERA